LLFFAIFLLFHILDQTGGKNNAQKVLKTRLSNKR
jgi:hypothetical protein